MNRTELVIHAIETMSIAQMLWAALAILAIVVVGLLIKHVLLRLTLRASNRHQVQLDRHIARQVDEVGRLERRIAEYVELMESVEESKAELRRGRAIQSESEKSLAAKDAELTKLRVRVADLEGSPADLKSEVRRLKAIRAKTEERLVAQNTELEALRTQVAEQTAELARLRALVEHVELSDSRGGQPDWLAIRESARSVKRI